jgi:uncharacterized protein (DUF2267 family)
MVQVFTFSRANCCVDEAFRDVDRALAVVASVFEVMRDWLYSVQTSWASDQCPKTILPNCCVDEAFRYG